MVYLEFWVNLFCLPLKLKGSWSKMYLLNVLSGLNFILLGRSKGASKEISKTNVAIFWTYYYMSKNGQRTVLGPQPSKGLYESVFWLPLLTLLAIEATHLRDSCSLKGLLFWIFSKTQFDSLYCILKFYFNLLLLNRYIMFPYLSFSNV